MSAKVTLERITKARALDELIAASALGPVVLFKHSTRCPTSSSAHDQVEDFVRALPADGARVGVVYVVEDRDLSDAITARFGIRHESPQVLVIRDGRVRWHGSHGAIVSDLLAGSVVAAA